MTPIAENTTFSFYYDLIYKITQETDTIMNPIQYVITRVSNTIPKPILVEAFEPDKHYVTLDERIREEVIIGRVLPDCNLYAGKQARIVLRDNWIENTIIPFNLGLISAGNYSAYRIPPQYRDNRKIVAVIGLDYPPMYYSGDMMLNFGMNQAGVSSGDLACAALNSISSRGLTYKPTPILRENNMVIVYPPQSTHIDWVLTCRLEYDEQFTNMEPSSIGPFVDLMECAIKAYIYNQLVLKIDSLRVEGGYEMNKFREIVESYADQNDKYQELIMNFRGGAILDPERIGRIIAHML